MRLRRSLQPGGLTRSEIERIVVSPDLREITTRAHKTTSLTIEASDDRSHVEVMREDGQTFTLRSADVAT